MSRISVVLFLCFSLVAAACSAQTFTLKPLSAAELQNADAGLDKTLLPDGARNLHVAPGQAFHVQIAGRTDVTLIPVQFSFAAPGIVPGGPDRLTDECGLYLIEASGNVRFDALQYGDVDHLRGLIQCSGVDGVGLLADHSDTRPQVILLFGDHTVQRAWSDPYLVSWSENDGRYVAETILPPASAHSSNTLTVAQVRRWLSGHH